VMARGNRRERIFRDEADRVLFYQTLGEACERTGWRVHACVLMSNHYHLMVETPEANLVAGMRWLQNTYTRRHNCRHRLWGRLFGDRWLVCQDLLTDPYFLCPLSILFEELLNIYDLIAMSDGGREKLRFL